MVGNKNPELVYNNDFIIVQGVVYLYVLLMLVDGSSSKT